MGYGVVERHLEMAQPTKKKLNNNNLGRDGGQVVSVLAFFSDNPSSNPADAYSLHWATFETSVICYILMLQNETKIITKASKTCRSSLL